MTINNHATKGKHGIPWAFFFLQSYASCFFLFCFCNFDSKRTFSCSAPVVVSRFHQKQQLRTQKTNREFFEVFMKRQALTVKITHSFEVSAKNLWKTLLDISGDNKNVICVLIFDKTVSERTRTQGQLAGMFEICVFRTKHLRKRYLILSP